MTYRPEDVAAVYRSMFFTAPRHSIWHGSHWLPQPTDPTIDSIIAALTGDGPPLSAYFLTNESETHVAAIDVDDADGWGAIEGVTGALLDAGVICYPERSRRSGHVWVVADRRIPAIVMRFALMTAVERAGFDPRDKHIEIRPSTDQRTSEFGGAALRAPWMPHPATGERYGLLDPHTMQPLHRKVTGALLDFVQADYRAVAALAERYVPAQAAPTPNPRPRRTSSEVGEGISAVLHRAWGIVVQPGRSIRCPLPAHDDRNPSFKVAADDRRAWCWSPTCVAHEAGRGITPWRLAQLAGGAA